MQNVFIPRAPDVVTILWERNPLHSRPVRTIVDSSIIGNANPCTRNLRNGQRLMDASDCLEANGVRLISQRSTGVFGISIFLRLFKFK